MNSLLARFSTDEFADSIGIILPPVPLRRVLQRSSNVRRLGEALRYGQVTQSDVREFVNQLLLDFRPGEPFQYDIALAALAVAMEHWNSSFAEDYLLDLARVQRSEFRASFRVARECLKARYKFPRTEIRTSKYPQGNIAIARIRPGIRVQPRFKRNQRGAAEVRWIRYLEACHAKG